MPQFKVGISSMSVITRYLNYNIWLEFVYPRIHKSETECVNRKFNSKLFHEMPLNCNA